MKYINTKNILIASATLILSFNVAANNITTINWGNNHSPEGGAFVLTPNDGSAFNTFCLERNEFINVGATYAYTISDKTDGGISGPNDSISLGTAWLYSNFRAGTLPGYTSTLSQQTELQNAFWGLENEINFSMGNHWIQLAESNLSEHILADANGRFGVVVWNLFSIGTGDGVSSRAQSQLALSVPDGGSTATLPMLGAGIFGLFLISRVTQKPVLR